MYPIGKSKYFLLRQKNLDSLVAAFIGFCVLYMFTSYNGIGVSPDSVIYTSVSRSLLNGQGFTEFDGIPMTMFPFFYPCFLAIVSFISHTDIIKLGPLLNSLLFALVVYLSGYILEKFIYPFKYFKWIVLITIITAPVLIEVFCMLWSETLFTVLILLFFIAAKRYFLSGYQLKYLCLVSILVALACVTRYAAITLISAGSIYLLLEKMLFWKKKIVHLTIFSLISSSLLIANLIRNKNATGGFTGHRLKSITPLFTNWRHYGDVMYDWLQLHLSNNGYIIIGTLVFIFTGLLVIYQIVKKIYINSYENMAAVFFIVYISFIVLSATVSRYEPINNRLLEPAYIPFLWSASYFLPLLIKRIKIQKFKYLSIGAFLVLSGLFLFQQILTTKSIYKDVLDDGIAGYTSKSYQSYPIINWMKNQYKALNPLYPIYSNVNDCVYFFTGASVQAIPDADRKEEVREYLATEPHYIIWFASEEIENLNKFSLKTIGQSRHLDTLQQLSDGGIYFCSPNTKFKSK